MSQVVQVFSQLAQMIDAQLKQYGLRFALTKVDTKAGDKDVNIVFTLTFPSQDAKNQFVEKLKGGV